MISDPRNVYLDHAAATPMDDSVRRAMEVYYTDEFYNPSALYLASRKVRSDITEARESVAKHLGCRPSEIIFTSGGTESNNLAIRGVMEAFPGSNLIISAVEHDSVLLPAKLYDAKLAPVDGRAEIKLDLLADMIDDDTVLVSIMYANNEVGSIQPLNKISSIIKGIRESRYSRSITKPLFFHIDACQAPNYLSVRIDADMVSLNGGKIYGPKQSGVLMVRSGVRIVPQILGGGQERGLRSGTENAAQIIGFAKSLDLSQKLRNKEVDRLSDIQKITHDLLLQKIPRLRLNGSNTKLANNIHFTIPSIDNERLVMELDELGIQCAVGSACSASNDEPSHVLQAMGMSEADIRSSIRISMGRSTTRDDMIYFVSRLEACL